MSEPAHEIRIAAVGDIALTHVYNDVLAGHGPHFPFNSVKPVLKSHDLVIGNLEGPLSTGGETYPMKCSLRADPAYIGGIKEAGFNVLSLANNHVLDYREGAFYETLELLDACGIAHTGAGRNLDEARKPCMVTVRGKTFGFLAYCDVEIDSPFYAGRDTRGIAPLNEEMVLEDIAQLKPDVDFVVLLLHWGMENYIYPTPGQVRLGRRFIDSGVHLILGHHPHVLQGYERYKSGHIFYSLGNFLFSPIEWSWENEKGEQKMSKVDLKRVNRESVIISMQAGNNSMELTGLVPACIADDYVVRPEPGKAAALRSGLEKMSRFEEGYDVFWNRYIKRVRRQEARRRVAGRLLRGGQMLFSPIELWDKIKYKIVAAKR